MRGGNPEEVNRSMDLELANWIKINEERSVTVKELHTFTDAEMLLLEEALSIASETLTRRSDAFRSEAKRFIGGSPNLDQHASNIYQRGRAMSALQLKIEAGR
jgi:hypothetical protein